MTMYTYRASNNLFHFDLNTITTTCSLSHKIREYIPNKLASIILQKHVLPGPFRTYISAYVDEAMQRPTK